ncbi:16S rRNA (guanine(527)-N(7))-methyltransferase RsmG [Limisalsivibrio acetivorans]|uniref:16S rRNA (guanine(527)-N(7))-methyltransferase RsmG n=1 Tax=Limisalsivibrio acetivorans TaxID=1304888 RepID=UPI0003B5F3E0|nr:16S rRNA (guanine(527)-N(7))-methyltransferase RsmG [Limisalsivibrio acetivorans]
MADSGEFSPKNLFDEYFPLSDDKLALLERFYQIHMNAGLNLTAITTREDFYKKHLLDSILLFSDSFYPAGNIADIGSGGGFPGIVIAIVYPETEVTLIDSIGKKCRFLQDAVEQLGLSNVTVINDRAENIKVKFDMITARGVAPVKDMLKWTFALTMENTVMVLYKGEKLEQELKHAQKLLTKKRLKVENVRYETPIKRTYSIIHSIDDAFHNLLRRPVKN